MANRWAMYSLLLICIVGVLFFVKNNVQNMSKELSTVRMEIVNEMRDIHILKAEFAYLASPDRVAKLAKKHLNLSPPDSSRILTIASVK